ncbi:MAG: sensor histidine kinase, partial [Turicibacter sp.]
QIADLDICAVVIDQKGEQVGIKNYYSGIKTKTRDELDKLPMSVPILPLKTYQAILSHDEMPSGYDVIEDGEGKMQMVIYRKLGSLSNPSGIIQISTYIEPIQRVLNQQLKGLVIYGGLVIVIGGILTFSLIQMTLIPLKKMQLVLSKVTPSELHYRLDEVTPQVEINEVSQSVNQMIERLERSFTKEKQTNDKMRVFISDVSHELRTPLTSIQGFVEVLQMGAAKNENHLNKALNSILMETQRLSKLVNDLLLLTKLDNQVALEVEKEDVSEIIQEILPQLEILVENKTLKMNLTPHLNSLINRDQIKQVIYNLVQNAIHYTDPDTGIIQVETKQVNRNNQPYVAIN